MCVAPGQDGRGVQPELSQNRAEFIARWLGKPLPPDIASWSGRDIERIAAWADTSRISTESANAAVRAVRERVSGFGVPLSQADLVTIERFHRTSYGFLDLEVVIDDPKAYTRPWSITIPFAILPDTDLIENICENEKDAARLR